MNLQNQSSLYHFSQNISVVAEPEGKLVQAKVIIRVIMTKKRTKIEFL